MRDAEGLLPQEAFDELLKFLFFRDSLERRERVTGERNISFAENPRAIRQVFSVELAARLPWAGKIWRDRQIHLSDPTLLGLYNLFSGVNLSQQSLDVRSVALRTFLTSGVRKGLGIYLTPEEVVRAMVDIAAPTESDTVLDPACGSGTFLIETVRYVRARGCRSSSLAVHGIDKNPRMLLLAHLNFGNEPETLFRGACADSLRDVGRLPDPPLGMLPESVDLILTNPPFGVSVTEDTGTLRLFEDAESSQHRQQSRVPSEVLFVDRCLRLLKPGGRLGIVLPRSVFTNASLGKYRRSIGRIGRLTELIDLPAETFSSTGVQTTTVAAFFRRIEERESGRSAMVRVCHVTNVGFDSTGRPRDGSQLAGLASRLTGGESREDPMVTEYSDVPVRETLQRAAGFLLRRNGRSEGAPLRDFVRGANRGRTPSRKAYTEEGVFILKVGNLTGRGIDWQPRDRNFVSAVEGEKRARSGQLSVREGDILLTSSAHASRYIAKKVDVVSAVPGPYSQLTFVGELIRVQPAPDVDPFVLLAALRHGRVRKDLQRAVRGQTAHLNPSDLLDVAVPWNLRSPGHAILEIAGLLRREADLAFQLSSVSLRAGHLLQSSTTTAV